MGRDVTEEPLGVVPFLFAGLASRLVRDRLRTRGAYGPPALARCVRLIHTAIVTAVVT
jgi:hypothetical protein